MSDHSQTEAPSQELQRTLSNRHIQLIALGGAIGTGLFMGSGKTISLAGPSIIFVYAIIGFMLFFVMRALGELLLSDLRYGSFSDFASEFLGPWAGFFTGWTYWLCWVVTAVADIVAVTDYMQFWFPHLPPVVTLCACITLLFMLNIVAARVFGEIEFWFALIKLVAIVVLILLGLGMVVYGFTSPDGQVASFGHLWQDGGMFPKGWGGFFAGFQIAVFAFVGIELVGTTAAETKDPERVLPKAVNAIPLRIIAFYILALIMIMAVTPWFEVSPEKSPFVNLFTLAGLPAAAGIINFVVLTSAASGANSGAFSTSRMMYGLARNGNAPHQFERLSRRAVPANGLLFSCACLLLGSLLICINPNAMAVFTTVTTIGAILFIFVWSIILCSYLVYRHRYPERHASSHYKMPMGRFMCVLVLAFFAFVLVLLTLRPDTLHALTVTPLWFLGLAVGYAFARRRQRRAVSVR